MPRWQYHSSQAGSGAGNMIAALTIPRTQAGITALTRVIPPSWADINAVLGGYYFKKSSPSGQELSVSVLITSIIAVLNLEAPTSQWRYVRCASEAARRGRGREKERGER